MCDDQIYAFCFQAEFRGALLRVGRLQIIHICQCRKTVDKRFRPGTFDQTWEPWCDDIQLCGFFFEPATNFTTDTGQLVEYIKPEWAERHVSFVFQIDWNTVRIKYAD